MSNEKNKTTLTDAEITTSRPEGRRRFLGLVAAGGAAGVGAALIPGGAQAQANDGDNGAWDDQPGCGRGSGGPSTGLNDADNGSAITDGSGRGRGAPYC